MKEKPEQLPDPYPKDLEPISYGQGLPGNDPFLDHNHDGINSKLIRSIGKPAGDNQEVQYNDNGAFGADPNFKWNSTEKRIELKGDSNTPAVKSADENGSILFEGGDGLTGDTGGGTATLRGGIASGTAQGGIAEVVGGYAHDGVSDYDGNGGNSRILGGSGLSPGAVQMGANEIDRSGPIIVTERRYGKIATINTTVGTLFSHTVPDNEARAFRALVSGFVSAGTHPNDARSAAYIVTGFYHRPFGGSTTLVGSIQTDFIAEVDSTWTCTFDISGNDVRLRVSGNSADTMTWFAEVLIWGYAIT